MGITTRPLIIPALFLALAASSAGGFRTFTDTQRREIEARIVSFDDQTGKVEIERRDGRKVKVPPVMFSESDQSYIRQWIMADQVLSEKTLRIAFKKMSEPVDTKAAPDKPWFNGDKVHYQITIDNRSRQPVENLTLEYRYFITVDDKRKDGEEYSRTFSGAVTVERIDASSSITVLTEPATYGERIGIVSEYISSTGHTTIDEKTLADEDLEGIWLKILGPEVDGIPVIRDVSYPGDLIEHVEWGATLSPRTERTLQRGFAQSDSQFQNWIFEALLEIRGSEDESELREISESIDAFYEDQYDRQQRRSLKVAVAYYFKGMYDLSAHWAEKKPQDAEQSGFANMLLAELYSSAPGIWDGSRAIRYAEQELGRNGKEPDAWRLEVLARAYARSGQYTRAVEFQERAMAGLSKRQSARYLEAFQRRLEMFKAGRPYDLDIADPRCWYFNIHIPNQGGDGQTGEYDQMWPQEAYLDTPWFFRSVSIRSQPLPSGK